MCAAWGVMGPMEASVSHHGDGRGSRERVPGFMRSCTYVAVLTSSFTPAAPSCFPYVLKEGYHVCKACESI